MNSHTAYTGRRDPINCQSNIVRGEEAIRQSTEQASRKLKKVTAELQSIHDTWWDEKRLYREELCGRLNKVLKALKK